jgi:hypothetical protein
MINKPPSPIILGRHSGEVGYGFLLSGNYDVVAFAYCGMLARFVRSKMEGKVETKPILKLETSYGLMGTRSVAMTVIVRFSIVNAVVEGCVLLSDTVPVHGESVLCIVQMIDDMDDYPVIPVCDEEWAGQGAVNGHDWAWSREAVRRENDLYNFEPIFASNARVRDYILLVCVDNVVAPDRSTIG